MEGTRTTLDLVSDEMEDIALHDEAIERYAAVGEFDQPEDVESGVLPIGHDSPHGENARVEEAVPSDQKHDDDEEKGHNGDGETKVTSDAEIVLPSFGQDLAQLEDAYNNEAVPSYKKKDTSKEENHQEEEKTKISPYAIVSPINKEDNHKEEETKLSPNAAVSPIVPGLSHVQHTGDEADVPSDEKHWDGKESHREDEGSKVTLEESICAGAPVGTFSFPDDFEDQTAISTLYSLSIVGQYFSPERPGYLGPQPPQNKSRGDDIAMVKDGESPTQSVEADEEEQITPQVNAGSEGSFRRLLCNQPCSMLEIVAVCLSLIAFILTGVATDRCDFITLENDHVSMVWDLPERTVGLFQFEVLAADTVTSQCLYWFDYPPAAEALYDKTWRAARIMSAIATFFGLMSVGFISTFSCISYKKEVVQTLAYATLIIPLLYGLSFVIFGSDVCQEGACGLDVGGTLMVLGMLVWFVLAAVLHTIPGAHPKVAGHRERLVDVAKRSAYLGLAMLAVLIFIIVVNLAVVLGTKSPDGSKDVFPGPQKAQNKDWSQVGETTHGPYPDVHDFLSLSGDAKVMSMVGKESVQTIELDVAKNLWYPFGNIIAANVDNFGWNEDDRVTKFRTSSASLSETGRVIAVGSSNWAQAGAGGEYEFGRVQVWQYHIESHVWIPKGHAITGESKGDVFASKVKLSQDGSRLAVLASGVFGKHQPYVRVYQYDDANKEDGNWVQLGDDIMLESFWTASGFAFSEDGSAVALGSLRIGRLGLVTVWKYDDNANTWNRRGSPISSGSSSREDQFGTGLAISGNGAVLVVGDPGGFPSYARAFWLNGGGQWEQLGKDLECSSYGGGCAHDVAMSRFGTTIAITGYSYHQMARIYSLDILKKEWVQLGDDIEVAKYDKAAEGTSIDISSDGRHVAIGVTFQDAQTQVWQYNGNFAMEGLPDSAVFLGESEVPVSAEANNSTEPPTLVEASSPVFPSTLAHSSPAALPSQVTDENATVIPLLDETGALTSIVRPNGTVPQLFNYSAAAAPATKETGQPWVNSVVVEDIVYFLFESLPRVERYDMLSRTFLPTVALPERHGLATALGINKRQMYVGYGNRVFRYQLNGTDETQIMADTKTTVIGFLFDGDLVFINAGVNFISLNGRTNTLIKQYFSFKIGFGTSITDRYKRIFGSTPDEVEVVSGEIRRRANLWFKQYNEVGDFIREETALFHQETDRQSASKTWMFPDQTRVVDDKGFVFSVAGAEHVYTLDAPPIVEVAWLGGEVMLALHNNGSLSCISQELVVTGRLDLDFAPAKMAVSNGEVFTFTHALGAESSIRVDTVYLGLLKPSLAGRSINPTNIPFSPEFVFVDKHRLLYMLSKAHSSIFVMDPTSKKYLESIKLDDIPKFVAYSGVNHEIYTLRENRVLSKIALAGDNRTEVAIATFPSAPLCLSTAGEFVFVCDDTGSFATHYTLLNNGVIVSSVGWNHYDKEFVWSDANRKMYFFRQADPTDLMTEHIFENGTIGDRVDSFLNNNSGFEHPIRVDPSGHHALLGSGIIHNAKTLKRMDRTLSNSILDAAFGKGFVHSIRNDGEDMVQLQQWNGHTFELQNMTVVYGRAHRILSLSDNTTVALMTNITTGIPVAYVMDEKFNVS